MPIKIIRYRCIWCKSTYEMEGEAQMCEAQHHCSGFPVGTLVYDSEYGGGSWGELGVIATSEVGQDEKSRCAYFGEHDPNYKSVRYSKLRLKSRPVHTTQVPTATRRYSLAWRWAESRGIALMCLDGREELVLAPKPTREKP